ncbi:MAG: SUMF1/EgtB/PvdO family nonheme iron enzyme [Flavobacteriales bacterium]
MQANNIQVNNTTLTGNTGTEVMVQFDLSWENSWRGSGVNNWDAAWVFVKYRLPGDGGFDHVRLEATGHVAPGGSTLDLGLLAPGVAYDATTNPVVGVFIRRDADGTGTFSASGVQLLWNYGALGITYADIAEVRVYAIEMVYVNAGAFQLGTGGAETNAFHKSTTTEPFPITSENTLSVSVNQNALWADGEIVTGTLSAAFPKGFAASYMMKYEMSQQQYVDFLNSLTRPQQVAHVGTDLSIGTSTVNEPYVMSVTAALSGRNSIRCDATIDPNGSITFYCDANGNGISGEADDGQWVACGNLTLSDVAAYLDWSGLRFMTELEYEKACRGPLPPLPNEFPWRAPSVTGGPFTLDNAFTTSEGIATGYSTTVGNAMYGSSSIGASPVRVGAFAAHPSNTGRISSGAGYYGVMELAGNMYELTISAGNTTGQAYTGTHGDGELTEAGAHDAVSWPAFTDADQMGLRGGAYTTQAADLGRLRVSDRALGATANLVTRISGFGGRGVRTAP